MATCYQDIESPSALLVAERYLAIAVPQPRMLEMQVILDRGGMLVMLLRQDLNLACAPGRRDSNDITPPMLCS